MTVLKKICLTLLLMSCLLLMANVGFVDANAVADYSNTSLEAMKARAEAFVNYEWTPKRDIEVWNENPHNGKMYFPAGETVKGVPYTLFFSEIGVDSLLSLEEFKAKQDINYSATAYCTSVSATRTGPVYGSCCATFVSEVFGGNFMNGISPKYDSIYKIRTSGYATTNYNVKAADLVAGDAIYNRSGGHIIWVGEVTDSHITIYEETPPVARKVQLDRETHINSEGYLRHGNSSNEDSNIYCHVIKSNDNIPSPYELDEKFEAYGSFKAEPLTNVDFDVYQVDLQTYTGWVSPGDYCTILEVYTNGWCKINYPLESGGTKIAYTPITNFISDPTNEIKSFRATEYMELFPTNEMIDRLFRIYPGDVCYYFGEADNCTQLFMPHEDGYYVLGWADISVFASAEECSAGDINGDGTVNTKDLTRLLKYLSGEEGDIVETVLDVNGDGIVNSKDLTRLMKYLAGEDVKIFPENTSDGNSVERFVYGTSVMGRELVCYSISEEEYDKTILLNFAIHGFEDDYAHDGQVLVDAANEVLEYYKKADLNSSRILIVPMANPDGVIDGTTNNGFGRCNADGIDLNRDFDANYVANTTVGRNYTPYAFSGAESAALRDLCLEYKPDIVLDFHGWLNTTIGDYELAQVFYEEMNLSHQVGFTSTNCKGYFANWAHQQGALGLLVEFKDTSFSVSDLISAINRLVNNDYDNGEGNYEPDKSYTDFVNVQCYTLSTGRVTTYRDINVPFDTISYIEGTTDLCTINKIYENGWVKVTYPISSGQKTAYCKLSDFIEESSRVSPYSARVTTNTKVYRRPDMSETIGSVWNTDYFYIVAEKSGLKQIIYPLDSGGYKMGWINASSVIY